MQKIKNSYYKKEKLNKPGAPIPEKTRREVWERCKGRCEYCGKKAVDPHHIIYRSKGGDNNKENLIPLCNTCHAQTNFKRDNWINYFQDIMKGGHI